VVLIVIAAGRYVVPKIPIDVGKSAIVRLIFDDNLFRNLETILVLVVAIS
jgi:hypothetical protein